ncbi:MAG TPA: FmdB family zinc ribbon protein [Gemmatimonadales bacterium]|nr:FmdB family zinc ribbon protein [Gemmatimonadales bacterium]
MPTYEYVCPAGHEFEKFQKMSDRPRAKCPVCGRPATRRMSGGAGLVFKGSGFYITDYGKDGKGPRKAPEGEKASGEKSGGEKGASDKPAAEKSSGESKKGDAPAKSESKPAPKKAAE